MSECAKDFLFLGKVLQLTGLAHIPSSATFLAILRHGNVFSNLRFSDTRCEWRRFGPERALPQVADEPDRMLGLTGRHSGSGVRRHESNLNGGFYMTFKQFISKFHQEESGQDMLEYALVTAAVLAAVVAGSTTLSTMIKGEINTITTHIEAIALP